MLSRLTKFTTLLPGIKDFLNLSKHSEYGFTAWKPPVNFGFRFPDLLNFSISLIQSCRLKGSGWSTWSVQWTHLNCCHVACNDVTYRTFLTCRQNFSIKAKTVQLDCARNKEQVQSISSEFHKHFTDFAFMESDTSYLRFPFSVNIDCYQSSITVSLG